MTASEIAQLFHNERAQYRELEGTYLPHRAYIYLKALRVKYVLAGGDARDLPQVPPPLHDNTAPWFKVYAGDPESRPK